MKKDEYLEKLKVFSDFKFFPEDHHYEYKGERVGVSVTRLIEQYAQKFDAEMVARRVAIRDNKTVEEVLEEWHQRNVFSCEKGSMCHSYVQGLWNGENYIVKLNNDPEFARCVNKIMQQANNFRKDFDDKLEHLADEFVVGSYYYNVASAIDHLFISKETGGLILVDYKTNSDIHKNEKYAKFMKPPLHKIKDCTLSHYYIQLSIYKWLVEKYADLTIEDMFIVYMSENIENYEIIKITYLKKEVEEILEWNIWS